MAEPVKLDLGKIISDSAKVTEAARTTSTSSGGSSKPDADRLVEIGQAFAGVGASQASLQKSLIAVDRGIDEARQAAVAEEGQVLLEAAPTLVEGAGRVAAANLKDQQENIALKGAAGLEPLDVDSVLRKSIEAINTAHDKAGGYLYAASVRENASLDDVFSGRMTFGDLFHAKKIDPAERYKALADTELAIAANEAKRINALQGLYSGQTQVNSSSRELLGVSAVNDARQLELARITKEASALQEKSWAIGARAVESAMKASIHREVAAHNQATLDVSIENAKRSWASQAEKTVDPNVLASYIRVSLRAMGRPDADTYTAERVLEMQKVGTPAVKVFIQQMSTAGSMLVGHGVSSPDEPLPAVYGSAGEVHETLNTYRGKMPPGSEQFQKKLFEVAGRQPANLPPAARVASVNAEVAAYVERDVKRDTDNSLYGKPHLPTLVGMASMTTDPAVAEFTKVVLTPLASASETVDGGLLLKAAMNSGLPINTVVAGLVAYKKATAAQVDSTRHPQLLGFPRAASLPYIISAPTGSMFGTTDPVDIGSEKSIVDYIHRYKMYQKVQRTSFTPIDAALGTVSLSTGMYDLKETK